MRKFTLSMFVVLALSLTTVAQQINVTGGAGRVNNSTVIEGLPFTATVTGLNGTPQRWSVGIGTVNGQLIFNTSATTISNAIVDREISGNTAVISVGATNGKGVSRFLTVVPDCTSQLRFLRGFNCSLIGVAILPAPTGATGYSWSVSPSTPFTNNGGSITLTNPNPFTTYTVNVTITGGNCDGQTISGSVNCQSNEAAPDIEDDSNIKEIQSLRIFPNPATGGELNLQLSEDAASMDFRVFTSDGQPVEGLSIEKLDKQATVDIGSLKPGIYYIKSINAEGKEATQRFRVE